MPVVQQPSDPSSLLPSRAATHTLESLYAQHGVSRPWIYWLILGGVMVALASLPSIKVNISVRAPGLVRPKTERIEIRPAVSGHIAEVLSRDNDRVRAGQPLLTIRSRDLEERLSRNHALQVEQADLIRDLNTLTTEPAMVTVDPSGDTAREDGLAGPLSDPPSLHGGSVVKIILRTAALRQERAHFLAQLESNRLASTKAGHELARYIFLESKGIATSQELEAVRFDSDRLGAEGRLLVEQNRARWQTRLRDERVVQDALASEARRLQEEQAHYTLRAPADGHLMGFAGLSAGGFVAANHPLGVVSPEDTLQVEAHVSPRDIGQIYVGQPARLQIDAYNYTHWGTLDGVVSAISGDLAGADEFLGRSAYKVLVHPASPYIRLPNGQRGDLKKGLTLSARFTVARRSLFQLLYEDAGAWLDPEGRSAKPAL